VTTTIITNVWLRRYPCDLACDILQFQEEHVRPEDAHNRDWTYEPMRDMWKIAHAAYKHQRGFDPESDIDEPKWDLVHQAANLDVRFVARLYKHKRTKRFMIDIGICGLAQGMDRRPDVLKNYAKLENIRQELHDGVVFEDDIPQVHADFQREYLGPVGDTNPSVGIYRALDDWLANKLDTCGTLGTLPDISISGHSIGGAYVTLAAVHVRTRFPKCPMKVVTWGAPKVGDANFKAFYSALDLTVVTVRLTVGADPVPHYPLATSGKAVVDKFVNSFKNAIKEKTYKQAAKLRRGKKRPEEIALPQTEKDSGVSPKYEHVVNAVSLQNVSDGFVNAFEEMAFYLCHDISYYNIMARFQFNVNHLDDSGYTDSAFNKIRLALYNRVKDFALRKIPQLLDTFFANGAFRPSLLPLFRPSALDRPSLLTLPFRSFLSFLRSLPFPSFLSPLPFPSLHSLIHIPPLTRCSQPALGDN
jgi:hypothetical protein